MVPGRVVALGGSNGCGLDIAVKDGRIVGVRGRADDRVNHGRLGPKGLYGWQANNSPDRLTRPLIRRNGSLEQTDWDTAMNAIVDRSKTLLAETGPGVFGFSEDAGRRVPALDLVLGDIQVVVDSHGPIGVRTVRRPFAPDVRNPIFHGQPPFYP